MGFLRFSGFSFLFASLILAAFAQENSHNSHLFPRPLILEYTGKAEPRVEEDQELELSCTSWRFAVEANNLNPWKSIPSECLDYVRNYMIGKGYALDLERVCHEASAYARSLVLGADGKDAWVFDVDETLLSNLPYYAAHGYGFEVFDAVDFDDWVDKAAAPAIDSSLKLYEEILGLGFKIILLTGRSETQKEVTVKNLMDVGFTNWETLMLRGSDDHGKLATVYKSEKRSEMMKEGFRILGNSGDQWSDLLGSSMSIRSFKFPNPMYYIP